MVRDEDLIEAAVLAGEQLLEAMDPLMERNMSRAYFVTSQRWHHYIDSKGGVHSELLP